MQIWDRDGWRSISLKHSTTKGIWYVDYVSDKYVRGLGIFYNGGAVILNLFIVELRVTFISHARIKEMDEDCCGN